MVIDNPLFTAGLFHAESGEVNLEMIRHRTGLWYRKSVSDLLSIREAYLNYKNVLVKNRIVMDIGANVGGFTHQAVQRGAQAVYSYEPEPYTYAMLCLNVGHNNEVQVFNRAVTSEKTSEVNFYVGYGNGAPSLASTKKTLGRRTISVLNESFLDLVMNIKPNTIKIDIEGGEYDIIENIPDSCDECHIEWHGDTKKRQKEYEEKYPLFLEQGWKVIQEKKREFYVKDYLSKGKTPKWCIDSHYRR